MFDIVLYQPEIPPNSGNIIRLCANTGCKLHLVKPDILCSNCCINKSSQCTTFKSLRRMFAATTKGSERYDRVAYQAGDVFVFGPETRGLPPEILAGFAPERRVRLPMLAHSRSLNLSNSAAVMVYEAWRQNGFEGGGV